MELGDISIGMKYYYIPNPGISKLVIVTRKGEDKVYASFVSVSGYNGIKGVWCSPRALHNVKPGTQV